MKTVVAGSNKPLLKNTKPTDFTGKLALILYLVLYLVLYLELYLVL